MGFSLTGTHIVFFIAAVIVAGAVSGIFTAVTMNISKSLSDKCDRLSDKLSIDFEIINDPKSIPSSGGYYLFYIKNIGDKKLETTNETFQIFIDGDLISPNGYHFSTSYILPSDVTTLYISDIEVSTGDHRLKVVGPRGIYDEFNFKV